jgi:hypothetical protein
VIDDGEGEWGDEPENCQNKRFCVGARHREHRVGQEPQPEGQVASEINHRRGALMRPPRPNDRKQRGRRDHQRQPEQQVLTGNQVGKPPDKLRTDELRVGK